MSKERWAYVGLSIMLVMVLIFGYFGIRLPAPAVPTPVESGARSVSFGAGVIQITNGGQAMTFPEGSSLTVASGATASVASALSISGGQSNANWVKVSAPTAIATATPAFVIDSAGVSNLLSVRAAGTPVFQVYQSGTVNGKVLRYAATGQQIVCGSTTITGTGTLPTGLATPVYVQLALAQDATGDCSRLSYTNAAATVTAKCWNTALTPAAATTPAAVNWCAIGTP